MGWPTHSEWDLLHGGSQDPSAVGAWCTAQSSAVMGFLKPSLRPPAPMHVKGDSEATSPVSPKLPASRDVFWRLYHALRKQKDALNQL